MIPKLAFPLIFLTIILLVIISPPSEFNLTRICEPVTSFKGTYSKPNYPVQVEGKTSNTKEKVITSTLEKCDLFSGEWIPTPVGPYYTNDTCLKMHESQNCMKYGKPDTGYLKWKWKPDDCELPIFDPKQFLELVRGKSIAFIGDSMARNHMQSLGCLLSKVVVPEDVSSPEIFKYNLDWVYKDYKLNMSLYWAPFLIRDEQSNHNQMNLYLDEFDESWTSKIERYNYIILSGGNWFRHSSKLYENGRFFACHACSKDENVTRLEEYFGFQKALRTAFKAINSLAVSEAIIFLRTISPTHFEGADWFEGGYCVRTRPFKRNETVLKPHFSRIREVQLEEFKTAQQEGNKRGLRMRLLDITQSMWLRPDAHLGKYGHKPYEHRPNDCMHWCLPGPIDIWNDMFLQLLKREASN